MEDRRPFRTWRIKNTRSGEHIVGTIGFEAPWDNMSLHNPGCTCPSKVPNNLPRQYDETDNDECGPNDCVEV